MNKLINNELSRVELDELLEGLSNDDTLADYSTVLEQHFNQLIEQESANQPENRRPGKADKAAEEAGDRIRDVTSERGSFNYRPLLLTGGFILSLVAVVYLKFPQWITSDSLHRVNQNTLTQKTFQKETVPAGKRRQVQFSDGSLVKVNAGSTIEFPAHFNAAPRTVTLNGEAFFAIQADAQSPVNIRTQELIIRGSGTSFNVKAYDDDDDITVTVRAGRVSVGTSSRASEPFFLTKDQQLVFNKSTDHYQINTLSDEQQVSWVDGFLQFDHTPLLSVEHALERWYDVDITVSDPGLYKTHFTGRHFNENLTSVLESICFAIDATYEKKDNRIVIKKSVLIPITGKGVQ